MKKIIIALLTLSLTACGIYKPYSRPDLNIDTDSLYGAQYATTDTTSIATIGWQQLFTDTLLQQLIAEALVSNTDMQSAQLRIEQAEATLKSARLAYLPTFNFAPNGAVSSFDNSKASWAYSVPVSVGLEIDIMARITNAKRQAKSLYAQSVDYRDAVQSGLIASVSTQYYTLLMLDEQLRILTGTASTYAECVRVMDAMKRAGMTNEIGVEQIRAAYYAVEASVDEMRLTIHKLENSLSLVLGQSPHPIARGSLYEQSFPEQLNTGIPVGLLSRRADVRASEQALVQAYYATSIARASLYPSLNLGGTIGWTNAVGSAIINPGSLLLSAAASILQPIFNAGANRARVKIAKSQQQQALLEFRQTVLAAGSEVNDALSSYASATGKVEIRRKQVESLERAASQTEMLMLHSSTSYLDVLTARQALLQAQLDRASDDYAVVGSIISLYYALGGGTE